MHSVPVPSPAVHDRLLSVPDLAVYLHVLPRWVYDASASGHLPCRKIGNMLRFAAAEIDAWLVSERLNGRAVTGGHDGTPLMTVEDLAAYLGVSRSWIYEARRSQGLPHFKLKRHLRFSRTLVNAWLDEISVG